MELDFDKYCVVDGSPTTVLPAPQRRSKVLNRKSSGKPKHGNDLLKLNQDFKEISFSRYRSASCRDVRARGSSHENIKELKRGSVYQSSNELRLQKKSDATVERKKIEFSRGSMSTASFGIIDSLCSSDEESSVMERNRFSVMSLSEQSTASVSRNPIDLRSRDSKHHSVCPIPSRVVRSNVSAEKQTVRGSIIVAESVVPPANDGNSRQERDTVVNLHKSLSSKLALPHSPVHSESESSRASSPKDRFSPVRKMFDPFVKSKSQKSPLSFVQSNGAESNCNQTLCKPYPNDLSDKTHNVECNSWCEKKENYGSILQCSPAHLHGILISENRNGIPFFEFSVKSPEDVYVAKPWKVDDTLSWIYTFHSLHPRRKSNAGGWGFKDSNKESSIVGQMHVSCYLCTELKDAGVFDDSMVTEFVLYDTVHSRKSTSSRGNSNCSTDSVKPSQVSNDWGNCESNEILSNTSKSLSRNSRDSGRSESSVLQPISAAELHPGLEMSAIVMQIPFEKRESLKFKSGDKKVLELEKEGISDSLSPGKLHIVIPAGNHSLPSTTTESCGPSPLLDRWRLGGRCDCGGWDMACPLDIMCNPNIHMSLGRPLMDNQHPAELFLQGRKDNIPAFSMKIIDDGKYAVDFHARLSSLQAFSICVSILHAAEASSAVGHERSKQTSQSGSLKVFAEEEIKNLMDSLGEGERVKANKKMEEVLPSFVVNPPFSPIPRV